jgi:hypothetical protein
MQAGGKHVHPNLTAAGLRHSRVNHLHPIGIAEVAYLNNTIVWPCQGFARSLQHGAPAFGGNGSTILAERW